MTNYSGYKRVSIVKDNNYKNGTKFVYRFYKNGKTKSFSSNNLSDLRKKVKSNGLEWKNLKTNTDSISHNDILNNHFVKATELIKISENLKKEKNILNDNIKNIIIDILNINNFKILSIGTNNIIIKFNNELTNNNIDLLKNELNLSVKTLKENIYLLEKM